MRGVSLNTRGRTGIQKYPAFKSCQTRSSSEKSLVGLVGLVGRSISVYVFDYELGWTLGKVHVAYVESLSYLGLIICFIIN